MKDLGSGEGMTSAGRQRLMQELRFLAKNPHPAMDIFPSESSLGLLESCFDWGIRCLYPHGTYMLDVQVTTIQLE